MPSSSKISENDESTLPDDFDCGREGSSRPKLVP